MRMINVDPCAPEKLYYQLGIIFRERRIEIRGSLEELEFFSH